MGALRFRVRVLERSSERTLFMQRVGDVCIVEHAVSEDPVHAKGFLLMNSVLAIHCDTRRVVRFAFL